MKKLRRERGEEKQWEMDIGGRCSGEKGGKVEVREGKEVKMTEKIFGVKKGRRGKTIMKQNGKKERDKRYEGRDENEEEIKSKQRDKTHKREV